MLALLSNEPSLLLAVSGGPDSVALMLLAARWPSRPAKEIAVATVDHGLREGSRAEAEQVGVWARGLGFPHHVLTWEGAKPATRIQERARDARYALLADCARRIGAGAIVTAHHADDQAETVLFRLTRGTGVAGLAGMAAETERAGVRLLRPLLGQDKAALEAVCLDAAHPFFRDPSNENPSFARARLRTLGAALADQGLSREALLRLGARAARAEQALAHCAAEILRQAVLLRSETLSRLDAPLLRGQPREIVQRALAAEIARLSPGARLRLDRLEHAAQRVTGALAGGAPARFTLGGALVSADAKTLELRPAPPRRGGGHGESSVSHDCD